MRSPERHHAPGQYRILTLPGTLQSLDHQAPQNHRVKPHLLGRHAERDVPYGRPECNRVNFSVRKAKAAARRQKIIR
jgi:hypothetical protein